MTGARVLLLCGGQSEEHEVSLASARSVLQAAAGRLELTPVIVDRTGRLLPPEASQRLLENGRPAASRDLTAPNGPAYNLAALGSGSYDVVFPLLHGPRGEDGTVQGLLTLLELPFVGSSVLGSAVGMDKLMMKAVFAAHGLPQTRYAGVRRGDWQAQPAVVLHDLAPLGFPVFVKPANLGSSVGISKAVDAVSLRDAIDEAARHDRRIIVEAGVPGVRELEVAVLGNERPEASPVGEIIYESDFYDYATKYTEGRAQLHIPADIPPAIADRCRRLALEAFRAADAAGLARVDFFYESDTGAVYVNEINTMPGFTTTSMYPKLWEAAGVPYPELVEQLIGLALERHADTAE